MIAPDSRASPPGFPPPRSLPAGATASDVSERVLVVPRSSTETEGTRRLDESREVRGRGCESRDTRQDSSLEAIDIKRNVIIHLATAVCMCTASPAHAHHSHGMFYDPCKSLTLEGRIERIEWKDPHILLDLKLDDGRTFHGEWISLREATTRRATGPAPEAL